jgi:hypothetical protein
MNSSPRILKTHSQVKSFLIFFLKVGRQAGDILIDRRNAKNRSTLLGEFGGIGFGLV